MTGNNYGTGFEKAASVEQDLTFLSFQKEFEKKSLEYSPELFYQTGLKDPETDLYTNLAYIISDQNSFSVKVGVYEDEAMTVFRDSREFSGSIFSVLEDTLYYLDLNNRTAFEFHSFQRTEIKDYDSTVLREALINALIHRDYTYNASTMIHINLDGMQIVNFGGLLSGLNEEDLKNGISILRNPGLAAIFCRFGYVEAFGTGIKKIFGSYQDKKAQPSFKVTAHTFSIWLPSSSAEKNTVNIAMNPQKQKILEYLDQKKEASTEEIQQMLGLGKSRVYSLLKELGQEDRILIRGRGSERRYLKK